MELKIYTFDCNGDNAPAYSCSEPEDNSGDYVKVRDVLELINYKINYLEKHSMYPAYGLNSQVESLKQLKRWFEED